MVVSLMIQMVFSVSFAKPLCDRFCQTLACLRTGKSFVSMKRDASRAFNLVLRASLLVQPKTYTIDMILSCNIDTECGKLLFSHGIFM